MNCLGCRPFTVLFSLGRRKADNQNTMSSTSGSDSESSSAWPVTIEDLKRELDDDTLTCVGKAHRNGGRCRRSIPFAGKYQSKLYLGAARTLSRAQGGEAGKTQLVEVAKLCSCSHHSSQSQRDAAVQAWLGQLQQDYARREARVMSPRSPLPAELSKSAESSSERTGPELRRARRQMCCHIGKRRTGEVDCEICKFPLLEEGSGLIVWCKSCGHQFHRDCWKQWIIVLATARIPKDPECAFCRVSQSKARVL